jgi:hypothetical protein
MGKGVKATCEFPIGSLFLHLSSGEGSAPADRLHLSAWLCDPGLSRHAHGVAWSPSAHLLLAPLHASRLARAPDLGRDGPVDTRRHHRVALRPLAPSGVWARASPRALVGAGSPGHLASTSARPGVSLWRWPPRRHTWDQASGDAAGAHPPAAPLVLWPALRAVEGGMGGVSPAGGLAPHPAQTPPRVSQCTCLVSRDGRGVCPAALGAPGQGGGRGGRRLQGQQAAGPSPGHSGDDTPVGLGLCQRAHVENRRRANAAASRDACAAQL